MDKKYDINDLINMMAALRNPNGGCPWDLEQNFATIAPYTIEEAYEVADAIDRGHMDDLREELGDLLLQPIYHAQMAHEQNLFSIHDVIHDITDKMISRHPHVFGDSDAADAEAVNRIWDERKKAENKGGDSALGGVTLGLPALLRAEKLQKKAAKTGFEWPSTEDVYRKIDEEIQEFKDALTTNDPKKITDELGDILLNVVNLARMNGVNPEEALRQGNNKFERRFKGMEADYKEKNKDLSDASLDEMMQSWHDQKEKERKKTA
ncbi:MAG: nucleoside triphosphate pyrophosphohydrolase [Micavibrio sp.]|nr:nucleoside triphosphate pyrophosphohydrolase [Micavibrio sp.]|tara:strand:+ start:1118 stop:1912 length:795 start_codon:yes stop_codon:yes gene_type:complete